MPVAGKPGCCAAKSSKIPTAVFGSTRPSGRNVIWLLVASSKVITTGVFPFGTFSRPETRSDARTG